MGLFDKKSEPATADTSPFEGPVVDSKETNEPATIDVSAMATKLETAFPPPKHSSFHDNFRELKDDARDLGGLLRAGHDSTDEGRMVLPVREEPAVHLTTRTITVFPTIPVQLASYNPNRKRLVVKVIATGDTAGTYVTSGYVGGSPGDANGNGYPLLGYIYEAGTPNIPDPEEVSYDDYIGELWGIAKYTPGIVTGTLTWAMLAIMEFTRR
jgi:hypothetical protein